MTVTDGSSEPPRRTAAQQAVEELPPSPTRHDFIHIAATAFVTLEAAAALWPLIASMNPAADVLAEASLKVNLAPIAIGQRVTVSWRGKPIFIDHRTPEEISLARAVPLSELRDPEPDEARVKLAEMADRHWDLYASRLHSQRSGAA
jgi:ubiquinol-cytochrome c reductase iron-sulfur subunit